MIEIPETVPRRRYSRKTAFSNTPTPFIDIASYEPDLLYLFPILGGEERVAMFDVEGAGGLATAFVNGADVLFTENE